MRLDEGALRAMVAACPRLTRLDIYDCRALTSLESLTSASLADIRLRSVPLTGTVSLSGTDQPKAFALATPMAALTPHTGLPNLHRLQAEDVAATALVLSKRPHLVDVSFSAPLLRVELTDNPRLVSASLVVTQAKAKWTGGRQEEAAPVFDIRGPGLQRLAIACEGRQPQPPPAHQDNHAGRGRPPSVVVRVSWSSVKAGQAKAPSPTLGAEVCWCCFVFIIFLFIKKKKSTKGIEAIPHRQE
jgi:hypothetical protein